MSFRDLHKSGQPFVIPNPWDLGSARMLAASGFVALASTSAGVAYSLGRPEGSLSLQEMLDSAIALKEATGLPVNADLENCGGNAEQAPGFAIKSAVLAGLDGASIEGLDEDGQPYAFDVALNRVRAAIAAKGDSDLMLTARAEGMLLPERNFDVVLRRISAFAEAGADVVFAPGLVTAQEVQAVIEAANGTPVNVLVGSNALGLTVPQLADLGVARISVGSAMARAAYGAMLDIAKGIQDQGRFTYPSTTASFADLDGMLGD